MSAFGVALIGVGILTMWAAIKNENVIDVFKAMFLNQTTTGNPNQPHTVYGTQPGTGKLVPAPIA